MNHTISYSGIGFKHINLHDRDSFTDFVRQLTEAALHITLHVFVAISISSLLLVLLFWLFAVSFVYNTTCFMLLGCSWMSNGVRSNKPIIQALDTVRTALLRLNYR